MNYGFIIDNRKCIGCHACTVACKQEHDLPIGVNRTWVKYVEKGEFPSTRRIFSVQRCNHCANAPCVEICPVTALWQRKDGIVDFSSDRCIGCKACMQACPYDAIYIHPDDLTAAKCNFCAHRVEVGLAPPCVNVCPEHAIIAGDMDDPTTEISTMLSRHQVQVRKPEKGTLPKVFYIEGDTASLRPTFTNTPEGYLWSEIPKRVYQISPPRLQEAESEARRVYDQGQSHTESWGANVAAYLWTKSIAAGIPLAAWIANKISGEVSFSSLLNMIAMLFLAITTVLLVIDLKQPRRFHWIIFRPQWKSWVARGAFILMGFGIFLGLHFLMLLLFPSRLILSLLFHLTLLFALGSAVYSAFLFWQAKGRDFWQSPLFAVHLVVMAFLAGSAAIICIDVIEDKGRPVVSSVLFVAILLHAAVVALDSLAVHSTSDAKLAARSMHHKNWMFWIGAVLIGMIVPLALLYFGLWIGAALTALAGLLIYERVWIRAGQIVPLS